ncbi:PPPDE peptidase [Cryptosporidium sp. chipmunk genotype I]|uniref:PPPDE peptidase n=1 Tax=Cryptosporidium sp. chipmunk genotype I TaxID=1280935 RepID=UPI00351A2B05|nr:PPPDE peptidase [Cryptosporidium sp. chipmunk genotype I]
MNGELNGTPNKTNVRTPNVDYFDQMENVSESNVRRHMTCSDLHVKDSYSHTYNNTNTTRCSSIFRGESFDRDSGSNMVILNVYDLDAISGSINRFTRAFELGAFHAGIEVYGVEYCFGSTSDGSSGITVNLPRRHPIHIYRESVKMGRTNFSRGDIKRIISEMKPLWPGSEYNIFRRNCLTFADELCMVLNVGKIPNYVKLLPELLCQAGDGLEKVTKHLSTLFDRMASTCSNLAIVENEQEEKNDQSTTNPSEIVSNKFPFGVRNPFT